MNDDELMDQLLRDAMAADVPRLSPGFNDRVIERLRPRRLTAVGRTVISIYVVAAAATAVWFIQDLRMELIAAAGATAVAAGASAYARRLASDR